MIHECYSTTLNSLYSSSNNAKLRVKTNYEIDFTKQYYKLFYGCTKLGYSSKDLSCKLDFNSI